MVPVAGVPEKTPFTAQVTLVSAAPVTVAVNVCVLPSSTEALAGEMVTEIDEGAGGGVEGEAEAATLPLLPAQPMVNDAKAMSMRSGNARQRDLGCGATAMVCERGRMQRRNAGEGPRENADGQRVDAWLAWVGVARKSLRQGALV